MSGILITVAVVAALGLVACALLLLSANDTAAKRMDFYAEQDELDAQLQALKAYSERQRRMREECADLRRRHSGGDHAA